MKIKLYCNKVPIKNFIYDSSVIKGIQLYCNNRNIKIKERYLIQILNGNYPLIKIGNQLKQLHRITCIGMLGRELELNETIHHIDNNKFNFSRRNLVILNEKDHVLLHKNNYSVDKIYEKCNII